MAKFCEKCGAPLNPGSKFCPECGAKIIEVKRNDIKITQDDKGGLTFDVPEGSTAEISDPKKKDRKGGLSRNKEVSVKTIAEETPKKKKGGFLKKALLFYLIVSLGVLGFTGFVNPGFLLKGKKDPGYDYDPGNSGYSGNSGGSETSDGGLRLVDTGVASPNADDVTLAVSDCLVEGGGEYSVVPYNVLEDKNNGIKVYAYDISSEQIPGNINGFMEIRIPYDDTYFDTGEDPRDCLGVYVVNDDGSREPELYDVDVENKEVIIYAEHLSKRELYHYTSAPKAEKYEVNFGNTFAGNISFDDCKDILIDFYNSYVEMSDAENEYYLNKDATALILKSSLGARLRIFPEGLNNYINDTTSWITNAANILAMGGEYQQAWISGGLGALSKLGLYTSLCKFSYAYSNVTSPWNVGGPSKEDVLNLYKAAINTGLDYLSTVFGTGSVAMTCAMYMSGVFVLGGLIDAMFEEAMYQKMYEMGAIYEYFGDTFCEGEYRPRTNKEWYDLFLDIVERYTAAGKQDYIEDAIDREIYLYATKFWSLDQEVSDSVADAAGYRRMPWPTEAEQEKLTETYIENLKYRLHPIVLQCERTMLKRCEKQVLTWYRKAYNKLNYKVSLELVDGSKEKLWGGYYFRYAGLTEQADPSIFQGQLNKDGYFDTSFCMNDWMRAGAPIFVNLYATEADMLEERNIVATAQMIPAKKAKDVTVVTFTDTNMEVCEARMTLKGHTYDIRIEGGIIYKISEDHDGKEDSLRVFGQAKPGQVIKVSVVTDDPYPCYMNGDGFLNAMELVPIDENGRSFTIGEGKGEDYIHNLYLCMGENAGIGALFWYTVVDEYTEKPIYRINK